MAEHTPGPWVAREGGIHAQGRVDTYDGPVWGAIACVHSLEDRDGEGRVWNAPGDRGANAHLIAAAPELLAALEQLRSWCIPDMGWTDTTGQELLAIADAAIAKARGEN